MKYIFDSNLQCTDPLTIKQEPPFWHHPSEHLDAARKETSINLKITFEEQGEVNLHNNKCVTLC